MATTAVNATQDVGLTGAAAAAAKKKSEMGSEQFMTLMVTQLQNQDPMKPVDPTDFLGQLAQFSTVSGIQEMKDSVVTLSESLRSSQVLGGSTLVGHEILADSSSITLGETGSVRGAVTIPENATSAAMVVTDASGALVRRIPLSNQQGEQDFTWDGTTDLGARAPAGTYKIEALANVGGAAEQVATSVVSKVGSVTIDPATARLTLNTPTGPVALANVRRVM